jgi:hypothetical protein
VGIKAALAVTSLNLGKERQLVGLNFDVGHPSGPQAPGRLLHDPLNGDQVDDGVGRLVEVLLGPIMVSQLLALWEPH